ncbi:hypothetical protein GLOTRDRAFT_35739 [Gloeophyllum trabeum ATCC 11539]|uniref:BED-type domain-containing protein n=1 Tax=Gloeophyllum trabeum (strain ATCC 11539 / FP-39264 / Madison 617) TaxID=670483 RepID=S7RWM2_GLOTA|nr:uncharacterized protein GLOTRDRAFT_35739 [Gloeophyllum trabeum ATCC 11539]EPQ57744.1 hypothetical protein GLOTRDRAFT_35739 [Gloeophyllum trabeum ATCC 11539]
MREQHPDDRLETVPKATSHTDPQRRVICQDCPGRLYSVGPGETLKNFELHLKNRQHRQRVADRVANAQTAGH